MFWNLVKHEMKHKRTGKEKNYNKKRYIKFIYLALFLVLTLVFITKAALDGKLELVQIWNALYGLPFIFLAISRGMIKREQHTNTIGWWLSLPYRRQTLVWAKFLAAAWRSIFIYLILFAFGIAVFLYALLLDSHLQLHDIGYFLLSGANVGFILIVFGPLVIALGILTGTLALTEYRYLVSFIWIGFWVVWALVISVYSEVIFHFVEHYNFSFSTAVWIAWLPCWILTYGLIVVISMLLERKLV